MTSDDIRHWFDGKYSGDRQAEMEQWFIDHIDSPELDTALQEILRTCGDDGDRERTLRAFDDVCLRLGLERHSRSRRWRRIAFKAIPAAAALVLGLVIGITFTIGTPSAPAPARWVEVYACAGSSRTVVLPDSSTLRLSPASVLIYNAAGYTDSREVFLYGGAYAEVTSNPAKPFAIRSNDATVTVLGTRFDVSNYSEDSEMEVKLYEGAVRVESDFAGHPDTVRLAPGEVVKFDKRTGSRNIIDIQGLDGHSSTAFHFIDKQLSDIVNELERHFGINIVIENSELRHMKFYAIFANNESLDQILDGLNSSGRMDIHRFDNHTIAIR